MATTMRVKKGDTVHVIAGKDRGKQGRVLEARPSEGRVIVENLNIVKRHTKPRPMKDANRMGGTTIQPGGVIEKPAPIPVSNVMVVCPVCNRPTRVGMTFKEIKGKQVKLRVCRRADCRPGDRRRRAQVSAKNGYEPRLKALYEQELRTDSSRTSWASARSCRCRKVEKITLNMGVGEAKTEAKLLDSAMDELTQIAGQRAQLRRARTSIAGFKIRTGMPVGTKVTLRGARMYEFLDRLVSIALPRIRDFRGLNPRSFDGRGNYSIGLREQIIFPEIDYDDVAQIRGLDVTITTSAKSDDEARALLAGLGLPFAQQKEKSPSGQEVDDREGVPHAQAPNAGASPLQPLRSAARRVPEVRPLPDLPARARAPGRDPRHDEGFLVGGYRC